MLYKRALAIYENAPGVNREDVAVVLNNLAALYWPQRRFAEQESLDRRALAIREKALRVNQPEVAESLSNLAVAVRDQGRFAEAEELFNRALTIYEKVLGPALIPRSGHRSLWWGKALGSPSLQCDREFQLYTRQSGTGRCPYARA